MPKFFPCPPKKKSKSKKNYNSINSSKSETEIEIKVDARVLEALARYHMKNHGTQDLGFIKNLILTLLSVGSLYLYATTSTLYAGCEVKIDMDPDYIHLVNAPNAVCNKPFAIRLLIGTMWVNFWVTWNTAELWLKSLGDLPEGLKPYLEQAEKNNFKNIAIGVASFVGSLVLASASTDGRSYKSLTGFDWAGTAITFIVNCFVNTFPYKILADSEFLSSDVPSFFHRMVVGKLMQEKMKLAHEKLSLEMEIKNAVARKIHELSDNLLNKSQTFNWKKFQWDFKLDQSNGITTKDDLKKFDKTKLLQLLEKHKTGKEPLPPSTLYTVGQYASFILTMGISNSGLSGYYIDAYNSQQAFDNSAWYINYGYKFVSNVAIAALFVLISYFTGRFGKNVVYETIVDLCQGNFRWPNAVLAFPKTIGIIIGFSIWCAWYSRGTALFLLNENKDNPFFEKNTFGELLWSYLQYTAYVGSAIFNLKNTMEFWLGKIETLASKFGNDDTKMCFELCQALHEIANSVAKSKANLLIENLQEVSDDELKAATGMDRKTFDTKVERIEKINEEMKEVDNKLEKATEKTGLLTRSNSMEEFSKTDETINFKQNNA